jgi:spermidine/putrescine transport system ATP-binding protein
VFQTYALFPHLSIRENVAFGLRRRGVRDVRRQVEEMLELVELGQYADRRPAQLSGGQQQRVALARALINRPQVLLLDEPLGALDLKLRRQMQIELKRIQTEVGITFVHVTHDQEEAMTMADTIAVMNAGVIEQMGRPAELYESPATTFVSNFLGQSNLVSGRVLQRDADQVLVEVNGSKLLAPAARARSSEGEVWVGVRPEKVFLAAAGSETDDGSNLLSGGRVSDVSFVGVSTQYLVRLPWGQELMVFEQNTGARQGFRAGDAVDLHWIPAHTFLLDASQDAAAGVETEDEP